MFRVLLALGLSLTCAASIASAADLPLIFDQKLPVHRQRPLKYLKTVDLLVGKTSPNSRLAALPPANTKPAPTVKHSAPVLPLAPSNLSWTLGPMVANADGGKREGSASATANIVMDKLGTRFGPEMFVELEGHVVKTAQSTVRLDIQIGTLKKSVVWNTDEVKSGTFKITLNEKFAAGSLPAFMPVSALAFVTQTGEGHVAMVSLERIVLRFGGKQIISTK